MKAVLTFDLPDENYAYGLCTKAPNLSSVIYDFTCELRTKVKHSNSKPKDWQEVSDMWWAILGDNGVDPYED